MLQQSYLCKHKNFHCVHLSSSLFLTYLIMSRESPIILDFNSDRISIENLQKRKVIDDPVNAYLTFDSMHREDSRYEMMMAETKLLIRDTMTAIKDVTALSLNT